MVVDAMVVCRAWKVGLDSLRNPTGKGDELPSSCTGLIANPSRVRYLAKADWPEEMFAWVSVVDGFVGTAVV